MGLSIGIVGLPNVGKSTLFNALTDSGVPAANYPFTTIDPNTGVVPIPDPRLSRLAGIFKSASVTPATVTFVDIAGLVRGASRGEGLGNQFLGQVREVDAICHVVRVFEAGDVVHVEEGIDPKRDIEVIETELAIADLETIDKRMPKLDKEATVDRSLAARVELLKAVREVVASGEMVANRPELTARGAEYADLHLLTAKPVIYVFNCDATVLADRAGREEMAALVSPAPSVFIDAQLEAELVELSPEDREEFLSASGQTDPGLHGVIRAAFRALGLQTFLTANQTEARAWTIPAGATAHQAAGVVHTDFQRGFVGADVADYDDLIAAGSWPTARAGGLVRTEGRSYLMRPNDVVEFRYSL